MRSIAGGRRGTGGALSPSRRVNGDRCSNIIVVMTTITTGCDGVYGNRSSDADMDRVPRLRTLLKLS